MTRDDDPFRRLGLALAEILRLELNASSTATPSEPEREGLRLYGTDTVAEILEISLTSVKALLGRELEIVHIGRSVKVPSDSLDAYIARLRIQERQRIQGEPSEPIDIARNRRTGAAQSADGHGRTARKKKATLSAN